jgi:DNA-binding CsgD family transcriptional regulator
MSELSNEASFFHDDYVAIWQELNQKNNDETVSDKYLGMSNMIGEFAKLNNQFISIFNTKSQRVLYLSENYLEVLGYNCSPDDYKKYSTLYWMRDLPLEQSWFFMQMTLFYKNTAQKLIAKASSNRSISWYMHNFKLKPPGGEQRHISLTCTGLELTESGSMLVMMLIIKDVTQLIKDKNTWWAEFNINGTEQYCFHQSNKKFEKGSILSNREKEVLKLIAEGLDSKEIGEKLYLSPLTVDKHKNNMASRLGAKDSSSLIQICKIGNII